MVLDDIMDNSSKRKGRPTAHIAFGLGKALSMAEILHTYAHMLMAREAKRFALDSNSICEIWSGCSDMICEICYAQCLDLEFEKRGIADVDESQYFSFLESTTPVDIANCFAVGALFAEVSNRVLVDRLRTFGFRLGMLMQLRDDFLDFIDNEDLIDKTPFLDIIQNKKRLPIILSYRYASPSEKDRLISLLGKANLTSDEKSFLHELLRRDFVTSYISQLEQTLKEAALGDLEASGLCEEQKTILRIILHDIVQLI
jgi:geranylgeranyl diphosphate synthase type I